MPNFTRLNVRAAMALLTLCLLACLPTAQAQRVDNSSGQNLGRVDGDRLYDASGRTMGRIDADRFYDASGRQIGRAEGLRRMQMVVYFYFFM